MEDPRQVIVAYDFCILRTPRNVLAQVVVSLGGCTGTPFLLADYTFLSQFLNSVAAILIFKMSDQQRTILEVIFRILILKNMGVDTKITLLGALKLILF